MVAPKDEHHTPTLEQATKMNRLDSCVWRFVGAGGLALFGIRPVSKILSSSSLPFNGSAVQVHRSLSALSAFFNGFNFNGAPLSMPAHVSQRAPFTCCHTATALCLVCAPRCSLVTATPCARVLCFHRPSSPPHETIHFSVLAENMLKTCKRAKPVENGQTDEIAGIIMHFPGSCSRFKEALF